jgi:hypothetical protein
VALDASNPYAHAMWGFETIRSGGTVRDARVHFATARESGRQRAYVRQMEIAALLWRRDSESEDELVRVVNEARLAPEALIADRTTRFDVSSLWNVYYGRVINDHELASFLAAVSPADHLATFQWLFAGSRLARESPAPYQFVLATLEEQAGANQAALATYRRVADELARAGESGAAGTLYGRVLDGVRRLSPPTGTEGRASRRTPK